MQLNSTEESPLVWDSSNDRSSVLGEGSATVAFAEGNALAVGRGTKDIALL